NGYDGNVLFENLELVRTARAAGAVEVIPLDLYVRRLPPTGAHFGSQRVRQAYDEFARPYRLAAQLSLLPATAALLWLRHLRFVIALLAAVIALAAYGRQRAGGARYFPLRTVLAAPLWLLE